MRRTAAGAAAVLAATAAAMIALAPQSSAGTVPGIIGNAGDPWIGKCGNNYCMYTSRDDGTGSGFPMQETRGFTSTDGINWTELGGESIEFPDDGTQMVFTEEWIEAGNRVPNGFVPDEAKHLWAPAQAVGGDGTVYLYVPDITDTSQPNDFGNIGVATSPNNSYFGPFEYVDWVRPKAGQTRPAADNYMSDPHVLQTGGKNYLYWATRGGFSSCADLRAAEMSDLMHYDVTTARNLSIDGMHIGVGAGSGPIPLSQWCKDKTGHQYLEGPSVYKRSALTNKPNAPGPYIMIFPVVPDEVPPECATLLAPENPEFQVIAYATANNPLGDLKSPDDGKYHWKYGGIIKCANQKESTNHGSIVTINGSGGVPHIVYYGHDNPSAPAVRARTLRRDCVATGGTHFAIVYPDSGGFTDCMDDNANNKFGIRSADANNFNHMVTALSAGAGNLAVGRGALGPWEWFSFTLLANPSDGQTIGIRAEVNGKIVTTGGGNHENPLIANRDETLAWEKFTYIDTGNGTFKLKAQINGKYVKMTSSGELKATATNVSGGTLFARMAI